VNDVGEPCAGEPHARFDAAAGGNSASRLVRAAREASRRPYHDAADVPSRPASLDAVQVTFDEQRLISDAGLMLTATLAQRLGIEELVNESVWLDPKAPGAALPGRKVMSLLHGMLAGADSIDDMNMLRAGSTGLILGHRVMAPSTLGTFLRAFSVHALITGVVLVFGRMV